MIAAIEVILVLFIFFMVGRFVLRSSKKELANFNKPTCDHQWEIVFDEPKKKVYRCTKCGESKEYTI